MIDTPQDKLIAEAVMLYERLSIEPAGPESWRKVARWLAKANRHLYQLDDPENPR